MPSIESHSKTGRIQFIKRIVLRTLGVLGLGLLTLVLLFFGMLLYNNRDQNTNFYLVDAELSDPQYLRKLGEAGQQESYVDRSFGFSAHRLKAGHGVVIARRHFSGGSMAIDDEHYDKLTIWLPQGSMLISKRQWHAPEEAVVVVSAGASAWPDGDCSGHVAGDIVLTPHGDNIEVRVEGEFQPIGNAHRLAHCQLRHERTLFRASPAALQALTPWEGGPGGPQPYDKTYPR